MEACVFLVAFVAHDFQEFLVPFQTTEPIIHLMCPALCKLMNVLQRKLVRKIKLPKKKFISMLEMAGR